MRRDRGPRKALTSISAFLGGTSRKTDKFLIDTLAIRIHPNSFSTSANSISNRHISGPRRGHAEAEERSFDCDSRPSKCDGEGRHARASAQDDDPRSKAKKKLAPRPCGEPWPRSNRSRSTRHIPKVEFPASPWEQSTSFFLLVTHSLVCIRPASAGARLSATGHDSRVTPPLPSLSSLVPRPSTLAPAWKVYNGH
jgi:hypothetical protein